MKALVIPVEGPVYEIDIKGDTDAGLKALQDAVGGHIEMIRIPDFVKGHGSAVCWVNEEGKYKFPGQAGINWRATDFLVPGVGLFMGDYIAGPMVIAGANYNTGATADLPRTVEDRVRLIESEAG